MTSPRSTRDRILDAFQDVLIEHGERAATIEVVAQHAGVSKGGLLYHFASKEAMVDSLIERLAAEVGGYVALMRAAPEGAVAYFIRTSVSVQDPVDQAIVAVARLAQGAHPAATLGLQAAQAAWMEVIVEAVHDEDVARAITLIGDGIYYNSSMGAGVPSREQLDALVEIVARLVSASR